jgi:hypothetical protein
LNILWLLVEVEVVHQMPPLVEVLVVIELHLVLRLRLVLLLQLLSVVVAQGLQAALQMVQLAQILCLAQLQVPVVVAAHQTQQRMDQMVDQVVEPPQKVVGLLLLVRVILPQQVHHKEITAVMFITVETMALVAVAV